jgi:hypothetical protein
MNDVIYRDLGFLSPQIDQSGYGRVFLILFLDAFNYFLGNHSLGFLILYIWMQMYADKFHTCLNRIQLISYKINRFLPEIMAPE